MEFRAALLEWRSTPRSDGHSLAAGFFGRHLRTQLPAARLLEIRAELRANVAKARQGADERGVAASGVHVLPPLKVGDRVHVQHPINKEWSFGSSEIVSVSKTGRSYTVRTPASQYVKNRRFLRPAPISSFPSPPASLPLTPTSTKIGPHRSKQHLKVRFDL